ncbi:MAG: apolipoprotein N-acyltransferase [Desulfuromonadales bacterium]|nr:apolipoprotein N-acyltransferase [Desulfuromonadales bacterium]
MMALRPLRDPGLALLSGLLLAAAFPLPDFSFLAWVALVPLLLVMSRRPFAYGFLAGIGFFAAALYWLNIVMVTYGRLPPALSILVYLILVCYLALYFALPVWLSERFRRRAGVPIFFSLPVLWLSFEFLRGIALTGFPWALIGYSQHANLSLIQSADLVGVYGVGFLIVFSNGLVARLVYLLWRRDTALLPWRTLVVFILLFGANWGYGIWRLGQQVARVDPPFKVGLIQGNIDQAVKWDPDYQLSTIQTYLSLSEKALQSGVQLLVWPESATPFYLQDASLLSQKVQQFTVRTRSFLLTGSPAYEFTPKQVRYLNSAFLLSPDGAFLGRSDKVHLVPFGEYVPLNRFLPFVNKLVAGIGDFSPGVVAPIRMDEHRLGVLVCYEGIFPDLTRAYVKAGSELLVNVTNDAWFGRSSAPYQHLAMTRFRAIENRRWLVRAANTGVSAIIAPSGAMVAASPIFQADFVTGDVSFRKEISFYTEWGSFVPLPFLLLSLLWFGQSQMKSVSSDFK